MNSKAKGETTEAVVLAYFVSRGCAVLVPFGNNQRYDLVIDRDGILVKGQCKTAVYRSGVLVFNAHNTNGFTGKSRGYRGQVDVFWVYAPHTKHVYEVPVADVGETQVSLRVDPPKRGPNRPSIRWAKAYELP